MIVIEMFNAVNSGYLMMSLLNINLIISEFWYDCLLCLSYDDDMECAKF